MYLLSGNGIESVVGGNLSPVPEFTGENLLVPGTGFRGSSTAVKSSLFALFSVIIVHFFTNKILY